ncbi:MAG: hypothetical protein R6V33_05895, partial [Pelovirga sp.]
MRIVVFLFTAATLHAVLLAFNYEGTDQNVGEHPVGVALVQRQWDQPMATDELKPQVSSPRLAKEEPAVKTSENRHPDVTEEAGKISVQGPGVQAEPPPPVAVEGKPVVMPDPVAHKPDKPDKPDQKTDGPAPSSEEVIDKPMRIPSLPPVEQVEESTVQHEGVPAEAVQPSVQNTASGLQ